MGDHSSVEVDAVVRKYVKLAGAEKGGLQFMLLGKKAYLTVWHLLIFFCYTIPLKAREAKTSLPAKLCAKPF